MYFINIALEATGSLLASRSNLAYSNTFSYCAACVHVLFNPSLLAYVYVPSRKRSVFMFLPPRGDGASRVLFRIATGRALMRSALVTGSNQMIKKKALG